MKIKNSYLIIILSLFVSSSLFIGCEDNTPVLTFGESKIRIINAIPDGGNIKLFSNDSLKTPNGLNFGESQNYINISGGTNKFLVKNNDQEIAKSRLSFKLDTNKYYTLFVAGSLAKDSLTYVSLKDDLKSLSDTTAKIRFVNLAPNSPYLDIIFSRNAADSVATFSNINFKSGADYKQLRPGNYTFKARLSGKKVDIINLPNFTIEAKKVYTLWLKGFINGSGNQALSAQLLKDN